MATDRTDLTTPGLRPMPPPHKSAAWPIAVVWATLAIYATLYPFEDWRDQGVAPWAFMSEGWPKYWTAFDVLANLLGYAVLAGVAAVAVMRGPRPPGGRVLALRLLAVVVACAALSFLLESVQTYLPERRAAFSDWVCNSAGAALGVGAACGARALGWLNAWDYARARWFSPDARFALVLMALWPFALAYPQALPFGLGHVLERLEEVLADWLAGTPYLEWLPVREIELQPMAGLGEIAVVALGLLAPVLLAYSVARRWLHRLVLLAGCVFLGWFATTWACALSFGPQHAWAWWSPRVQVGIVLAVLAAVAAVRVGQRGAAVLGVLVFGVLLTLINSASVGAYLWHTLQLWEQGRFIRFHGIAQWLGWLWPYAALAWLLGRAMQPSRASDAAPDATR